MLKRFFELLPSAFASVAFFILGRYIFEHRISLAESLYFVIPAWLAVLAISAVFKQMEDLLFGRTVWPEMLAELREILLSAVRNGYNRSTSATIEEWIANEETLGKGSCVYTMTHDLYLYDFARLAYETTARNLREGVRYFYYLDRTVSNHSAHDLHDLIFAYLTNNGKSDVDRTERLLAENLVFRKLRYPLLYPFSVIERRGAQASAHWYTAEPVSPGDKSQGIRLVVLDIANAEHVDKLQSIFRKLKVGLRSRKLTHSSPPRRTN